MEDYKKIIARAARSFYYTGIEKKELLSLCYLGYHDAVRSYNPNKKTTLYTHAYSRMRGCVMDFIREMRGDKRNPKPEIALENLFTSDHGKNAADIIDTIYTKQLIRRISSHPKTSDILNLRIQGFSMRQIGTIVGLTESRISQIIKELRCNAARYLDPPLYTA